MEQAHASLVLGPRTASKSAGFQLAGREEHALLADLAGIRVDYVESLPPGVVEPVAGLETQARVTRWRDTLALVGAESRADFSDGRCALARKGGCWYVAGWMDEPGWRGVLEEAARHAGLAPALLPDGLRLQREGDLVFAMNFSTLSLHWKPSTPADCLLGGERLGSMDVAIWKTRHADA
jgi:beta-galactosidase